MARPSCPCFAGLDGGGTRTLCVVYSPETGALGTGTGGPLNPNYVTPETAEGSVLSALQGALREAGLAGDGLLGVAASAPWAEDLVRAVVRDIAPRAALQTPGEDVAALLGGTLRDHGLVLIAGTGSRCAYVPPPGGGTPVVSGAWGSLFGDEGSGYDIGRSALQAVTRAWDGRGPETVLVDLVSAQWSLRDPKDLVRAVYALGPGRWRERVASVCPLVGWAAAGGDPVASGILDRASAELALLVESVVGRAGLDVPAGVLLSGGVFGLGDVIVGRLDRLFARSGAAVAVAPLLPPVCGALFAAMPAASGTFRPGRALVERLRKVPALGTTALRTDGTLAGSRL